MLDDGGLNKREIGKLKEIINERVLNKKYILFTAKPYRPYLDFFISAGIRSILSKKDEIEIIREGIIKVHNGQKFWDDEISELYINQTDEIEAKGS